jgi:hypothetical protein
VVESSSMLAVVELKPDAEVLNRRGRRSSTEIEIHRSPFQVVGIRPPVCSRSAGRHIFDGFRQLRDACNKPRDRSVVGGSLRRLRKEWR